MRQDKFTNGEWVVAARAVDNCTESDIKLATQPFDRIVHETLDVLVWIILALMSGGTQVSLSKRDLKAAFRG